MSWFRQFLVGNVMKSGNPQDGLFQKADGTVWLRNPDGSETQVGAGDGSSPQQELINLASASDYTPGDNLVWMKLDVDPPDESVELLDLTDPQNPTIKEAGTYAFSIQIPFACLTGTPADTDYISGNLFVGDNGNAPFQSVIAPFVTDEGPSPGTLSASLVYKANAGDVVFALFNTTYGDGTYQVDGPDGVIIKLA